MDHGLNLANDKNKSSISLTNQEAAPQPTEAAIVDSLRDLELREVDLTRKKAFRAVAQALVAVTVVRDRDGDVIAEVPNHSVRLQASRDAREILRDNEVVVARVEHTFKVQAFDLEERLKILVGKIATELPLGAVKDNVIDVRPIDASPVDASVVKSL